MTLRRRVGGINAHQESGTATGQRTRLPERNLDVLRAVAVLLVLANHIIMAIPDTPALAFSWWLGRAGVLCFFVHTSVVLMASIERHDADGHDAGAFYIRRAFRIYPLSVAAILCVLAIHMPASEPVHGIVTPFVSPGIRTLSANLFLVQNLTKSPSLITVLWTLPVELQMYAVLPLCYLLAKRGAAVVAGLLVLGVAGGNLWASNIVPALSRVDTLVFVPCFVSGVLAYAILRHHRPAHQLPSWMWPALLLVICTLLSWENGSVLWNSIPWMQWGFCIVLGLAMPVVAELSESLWTRLAKVVAKYSYGIYLLHLPALWIGVVLMAGAPPVARWLVSLTLIVVLPVIGYHTIEEPAIRLGVSAAARWRERRRTRGSVGGAGEVPVVLRRTG